jgi:hypothetical protein
MRCFDEALGRAKPPGVCPGGNGSLCNSFISLGMLSVANFLFRIVTSLFHCCCSGRVVWGVAFFIHLLLPVSQFVYPYVYVVRQHSILIGHVVYMFHFVLVGILFLFYEKVIKLYFYILIVSLILAYVF